MRKRMGVTVSQTERRFLTMEEAALHLEDLERIRKALGRERGLAMAQELRRGAA